MKLVRSQLQKSQLKSDGRIATEELKKDCILKELIKKKVS